MGAERSARGRSCPSSQEAGRGSFLWGECPSVQREAISLNEGIPGKGRNENIILRGNASEGRVHWLGADVAALQEKVCTS